MILKGLEGKNPILKVLRVVPNCKRGVRKGARKGNLGDPGGGRADPVGQITSCQLAVLSLERYFHCSSWTGETTPAVMLWKYEG